MGVSQVVGLMARDKVPTAQGGVPMGVLRPCVQVDKQDRPTQETVDRTQFMLNQDFETWKQWKASVRPEDCLMPHRQPQGTDPPPLPSLSPFEPSLRASPGLSDHCSALTSCHPPV